MFSGHNLSDNCVARFNLIDHKIVCCLHRTGYLGFDHLRQRRDPRRCFSYIEITGEKSRQKPSYWRAKTSYWRAKWSYWRAKTSYWRRAVHIGELNCSKVSTYTSGRKSLDINFGI